MKEEKKLRFIEAAKKIVDELEKLNVVVKPQDLVDEARPKSSPLHGYFVWDDSEAAESYRCHQAGQMIARVRIKYENNRVRAYQKVKVTIKYNGEEKEDEGYVSTARILSKDDLRRQVVKQGMNELYRWKNKFSVYDELMALLNIEEMERLSLELK